jgi:hypothetical protein
MRHVTNGLAFGAAYLIGKFPGTAYGRLGLVHPLEAVKLSPYLVGSEIREAKFIGGACAKAHCFLVDDQGDVWGCGNNVAGQLGLVSLHVLYTYTHSHMTLIPSASIERSERVHPDHWSLDKRCRKSRRCIGWKYVLTISNGRRIRLFCWLRGVWTGRSWIYWYDNCCTTLVAQLNYRREDGQGRQIIIWNRDTSS